MTKQQDAERIATAVHEQLEKAMGCDRYLVAVYRIENNRVILDPVQFLDWPHADFPACVNMLKNHLSKVIRLAESGESREGNGNGEQIFN